MTLPVTCIVTPPRSPQGAFFVLAHGAGGSLEDPLLVEVARALAKRGHGVARFNFGYRDAGRRLPDRAPILEATWLEVLQHLRRRRKARRFILGGKSMGGRMASHLAARGEAMHGLLLLGYPLQPMTRPSRKPDAPAPVLRSAHLPEIEAPTLFVQGTRDPLCDLALLRPALASMKARRDLLVIEGADHSLAVPKKVLPRAAMISLIVDRVETFFEL